MTRDEALRMAIEAIENADYHNDLQAIAVIKDIMANVAINDTSQERVDEIEKQRHEPVAWISATELLVMRGNALGGAKDWRVNLGLEPEEGDVGLYTTPPQRTWVGLTDEEIKSIWLNEKDYGDDWLDVQGIARAIEAKLKEKNFD